MSEWDAFPLAQSDPAGWDAFPLASAAPTVGVGEDVAKQIGSGLVTGTEMIATAPAHLLGLAGKGADYLMNKYVPSLVSPEAQSQQQQMRDLAASQRNGGIAQYLPKPETTAGEFARTAAEFVPSAASLPGRIARNVAGGVVAGLGSEAGGQLTKGTEAEPYARFGGAIFAPIAAAAVRRAITPLPATAERTAAVTDLQNAGVQSLTAGQITGSKPLQWFEQALGDIPGSGRRTARTAEQQGEQFTRAALMQAGENAPRATPEVIDRAFNRIGNQFETIAARNTVHLDQQLGRGLQAVEGEYNGLVSASQRAPVIQNTVRDIGDIAARHNGIMPGDAYGAMRSRLGRQARGTTDPQLQQALYGLQHTLDDAMTRSLTRSGNTADIQGLAQARRQYRNMLVVEKAATGAGENAALGLISPSHLRNATVAQGRRNYARGQGDFANLARSGEAIMKSLPQSGTAPRSYASHLPTAIGATLGGIAGGVPGAALGGLSAIAGPPLLGRLLMSRPVQAYLRNQAFAAPAHNLPRRAAVAGLLALQQNRGILPY